MARVDPEQLGEFGRYQLLHQLGKGGMARVYRAVRSGPMGFRREVALKILDHRATESEEQVRALIDEARLGGLLRHRNIVGTDEFEKVGETFYIAMEYVDGWSLDRVLKLHRKTKEPVPIRAALELMLEVCHGLYYAHSRTDEEGQPLGIVHRDLKPGNIMVSRRGEVKIMDFGIAKAATNLYRTQEGHTRGTPLYMSPEQVMGGDLDHRSDLFSLGSILHVLITLKPCFKGDSFVSIMRAVLDVDTAPAQARIKQAVPDLLPMFRRLMETEPVDRYDSAAELEKGLSTLLESRDWGEDLVEWIERIEPFLPASGGTAGGTVRQAQVAISNRTDTWDAGSEGSPETLRGDLRELSPLVGLHEPASGAGDPGSPLGMDVLDEEELTQSSVSTPAQSVVSELSLADDSLQVAAMGHDVGAGSGAAPSVDATAFDAASTSLGYGEPLTPLASARETRGAAEHAPWSETVDAGAGRPPQGRRSTSASDHRWQRDARRAALFEIGLKVGLVAFLLFLGLPFVPGPVGSGASSFRDATVARLVLGLEAVGFDMSFLSYAPVEERRRSLDRNRKKNAPSTVESEGLVAVAGGHAFLGQRGEADAESSLQAVEIPPFRMMATEVTLAKFEAWCSESVLGTRCKAWLGAENWQGRHHPVVNVPWHLASDYCAAWGGRLPSESEWEFAARSEARRLYPWGDLWQEASANYCDLGCDHSLIPTTYVNDGHAHTAAVGSFPDGATPEGILDLSGNVAEWTLDCWTPSHRRRSSWLPTAGACSKRVVRGGAWRDPKSSQAAWRRAPAHATSRSVRIGFRCVRGLDPVLP